MRLLLRFRPLLVALALAAGTPAVAQDLAVGFDPRTGDVWVDTWLADVNRYGTQYRDPFVDELVRYHRAPRELVLELLDRPGWTPGDVYFACSLAAVSGRPCRQVAEAYERDPGAGWGALAQRLGIRPGSPEFHRLKRGFVPTYDRWGRTIRLDPDLERAFPGRGKASPARGRAGDRPTGGLPGSGAAARGEDDADPRGAAPGARGKSARPEAGPAGEGNRGKGRGRDKGDKRRDDRGGGRGN